MHTVATAGQKYQHPHRHHHPSPSDRFWQTLFIKSIPKRDQPPPPAQTDDGWVPDEIDDLENAQVVTATDDDDPDVLEGPHRQRLYQCEEEGCIKVYQSFNNWHRHVSVGKHTIRKERQSLRDFSIGTYVRKIEESKLFSKDSTIVDAIRSQQNEEEVDEEVEALPMNWAEKVRRPTKQFTIKQKNFLTEKFNEGAATGNKYDPHDVAEQMRKDARFPWKDDWLKYTQIASFWSRLSRQREQTGGSTAGTSSRQEPLVEEYDLEEVADDEYANAYQEHVEDSIQQVIDDVVGGQ